MRLLATPSGPPRELLGSSSGYEKVVVTRAGRLRETGERILLSDNSLKRLLLVACWSLQHAKVITETTADNGLNVMNLERTDEQNETFSPLC